MPSKCKLYYQVDIYTQANASGTSKVRLQVSPDNSNWATIYESPTYTTQGDHIQSGDADLSSYAGQDLYIRAIALNYTSMIGQYNQSRIDISNQ